MKHSATRNPHRGPTQGTHTEGTHTGDPHRGPAQGTHTGDPHRGEGPTEDPPPEGRATQGTHTEHTQTVSILVVESVQQWKTGREFDSDTHLPLLRFGGLNSKI